MRMIGEICDYLRNYFIAKAYVGHFKIQAGEVVEYRASSSAFPHEFEIQPGQYYKVEGSLYHNGVHKYPDCDAVDEEFDGAICTMAVPGELIRIANEISDWRAKYEAVDSQAMSPYNSESFGGYSYSKQGGTQGGASGWRAAFGSRLTRWRKI